MAMKRMLRGLVVGTLAATMVAGAGERVQSFAVKKGGQLTVRVDAGPITVRGWDKVEVFVRVTCDDEERLRNVSITEGGGKVQIESRWRGQEGNDIAFEISVPSQFDVDLRTAGGHLTVEGPLAGNLGGSTAGGKVTLGTLGGTVRMETAGGTMSASEINGDLFLRSAGGDITVKSVSGSAELSTAGGRISVTAVARNLEASTAGGEVRVGTVGGTVRVSTAGGSIKVQSGRGKISLNSAGGGIELASGRGNISANTSAGNIVLHDVQGSVAARTAAGDVNVTLDPAPGESSSLATSAGSIVLTVPEHAKASIVARNGRPYSGGGDELRISSDFPLTRGGAEGRRGEAQIELNGGGHRISLETMMGSISIRKQ